jgi:hypothetical protein
MPKAFLTAIAAYLLALSSAVAVENEVGFAQSEGSLAIKIGGRSFGTYVYRDDKILRPYFAHLHAPGGSQVTRHHPPIPGTDAADHDTMHPGLWLGFGDISGADFWRNKAVVRHVEFIDKPSTDAGGGRFAVRNRYVAHDKTVCEEVCRVAVQLGRHGYLILLDSRFSGPDDFYFGDQEEMGLGVRVATPMAVKNGGSLTNSDGLVGEKQVWGKQADWCDYSGVVAGMPAGILLVPDPKNFRRSWFHARDYGFVAANPFGRNAFTKGEKSKVTVPRGESLRLGFAILFHAGPVDLPAAYAEALQALGAGG